MLQQSFRFVVRYKGSPVAAPVIPGVQTRDPSGLGFKGLIEASSVREALVAVARGVFPTLAGEGRLYRLPGGGYGVSDPDPELGHEAGLCRGTITLKAR